MKAWKRLGDKTRTRIIAVVGIACTAAIIVGVYTGVLPGPQREEDECTERGIEYFKEIGSYPRLRTTNELADDVARDRCSRAPKTAFPK